MPSSSKLIGLYEDTGNPLRTNAAYYRPVLVVQTIKCLPQFMATPPRVRMYGSQVLFYPPTLSMTLFNQFLLKSDILGQRRTWGQLGELLISSTVQDVYATKLQTGQPRQPQNLIADQVLVLMSAGVDPLHGNFLEFEPPEGGLKIFNPSTNWWNLGP